MKTKNLIGVFAATYGLSEHILFGLLCDFVDETHQQEKVYAYLTERTENLRQGMAAPALVIVTDQGARVLQGSHRLNAIIEKIRQEGLIQPITLDTKPVDKKPPVWEILFRVKGSKQVYSATIEAWSEKQARYSFRHDTQVSKDKIIVSVRRRKT